MNKKLLLTTTALVAFTAASAFADANVPPKVHTGLECGCFGSLDFQAGFRSQNKMKDSSNVAPALPAGYSLEVTPASSTVVPVSCTAPQHGGCPTACSTSISTTPATSSCNYNATATPAVPANTYGITHNNENVAFNTEAHVGVEAHGKTAKGLKYGAKIGVQPTVESYVRTKWAYLDRSFIYMEDKDMGRLELGNKEGASDAMFITAGSIAAATGGIAGDWYRFANLTNFDTVKGPLDPADFALTPASYLDRLVESRSDVQVWPSEKTRKITYYTPKYNGLQFGVTYIPDTWNVRSKWKATDANALETGAYPFFKDALTGGITYESNYKDHKFNVGVVAEYASLNKELKKSWKEAMTVGIGASYMWKDLMVAGSYNYLGDSGLAKNAFDQNSRPMKPKKENYVATLGACYAVDSKTNVSLTGLMSEKWKNKFWLVSLGADYKLAPGLMPYAEVSFFNMRQETQNVVMRAPLPPSATMMSGPSSPPIAVPANVRIPKVKNDGVVFILGTKIQF